MGIFEDLTALIEKANESLTKLDEAIAAAATIPDADATPEATPEAGLNGTMQKNVNASLFNATDEKGTPLIDQVIQNAIDRSLQGNAKGENGGFITTIQKLVQGELQGNDEKSGVIPRLNTLEANSGEHTKKIASLETDILTVRSDLSEVNRAIDSLQVSQPSHSNSADNPEFQSRERLADK